ncbi:MAG TPA: hypothetical protein VFX37_10580 [Pseudolabrys sp.]|nr:hypothetical protein [Pseudolabrys sp.]
MPAAYFKPPVFHVEIVMPESLHYVAEAEPWATYRLEDGSVIRVKIVMTHIHLEGFLPDGRPNYRINFQQIVDVTPGEHLKDTPIGKKEQTK